MAIWDPKANELFVKALEIQAAGERQRFLDEACAGDADLPRRSSRVPTMERPMLHQSFRGPMAALLIAALPSLQGRAGAWRLLGRRSRSS